jgi:hypothetical protein
MTFAARAKRKNDPAETILTIFDLAAARAPSRCKSRVTGLAQLPQIVTGSDVGAQLAVEFRE